ncbi:YcaO-like family protein [Streptomyces xanthochromogenes]|uniref:YcaO-like family protein n=1 Tax=Streptomyces xanthochromogenes TaxID=67384 RepID=UPI0037FE8DF9
MIDYLATIEPAAGVVRTGTVLPPRLPEEPLWRGLMELDWQTPQDTAEPGPLAANVVGAYGVSRSDVLVRAIGEAVERYALRPHPQDDVVLDTSTALGTAELAYPGSDTAKDDLRYEQSHQLRNEERPLRLYRAARLHDGQSVRVPAGLVDFPAAGDDACGFDPSPSGAAAGPGYRAALRSALLETIERDAVLIAWARALELPRIDLTRAVAQLAPSASRKRLCRAIEQASKAGWEPVVAQVPTSIPGVVCAVGVVVDRTGRHPLAAVGCKASTDPAAALAGAVQEALQIRSVLHVVRQRLPDAPAPAAAQITDDTARAVHFASEPGTATVQEWINGFTSPGPLQLPLEQEEPDLAELIVAVHRDGGRPLAVDLTHRLPERLRSMGWAVVKVVPDGYQPLRVNESHKEPWHHQRLASVPARTGGTAHRPMGETVPPHPLI